MIASHDRCQPRRQGEDLICDRSGSTLRRCHTSGVWPVLFRVGSWFRVATPDWKGKRVDTAASHRIEDRNDEALRPNFVVISSVPSPPMPAAAEAMTIHVTLPPGSPGLPPHRHSGPAFGYVVEGEVIFELEGEPERVVRAGETFWEPGGDVIHYQDGNNLPNVETTFVVMMFCVPGQPMVIPVTPEELEQRRARRAPRP